MECQGPFVNYKTYAEMSGTICQRLQTKAAICRSDTCTVLAINYQTEIALVRVQMRDRVPLPLGQSSGVQSQPRCIVHRSSGVNTYEFPDTSSMFAQRNHYDLETLFGPMPSLSWDYPEAPLSDGVHYRVFEKEFQIKTKHLNIKNIPKEVGLDKLRQRLLENDVSLINIDLSGHGMRMQDMFYLFNGTLNNNTVLRSLDLSEGRLFGNRLFGNGNSNMILPQLIGNRFKKCYRLYHIIVRPEAL